MGLSERPPRGSPAGRARGRGSALPLPLETASGGRFFSSRNSRSPDLSFLSSPGSASVLKKTFPETESTSGEKTETKPPGLWASTVRGPSPLPRARRAQPHRGWRGDTAWPRGRSPCPRQGQHQTVLKGPFRPRPTPDPVGPHAGGGRAHAAAARLRGSKRTRPRSPLTSVAPSRARTSCARKGSSPRPAVQK